MPENSFPFVQPLTDFAERRGADSVSFADTIRAEWRRPTGTVRIGSDRFFPGFGAAHRHKLMQ